MNKLGQIDLNQIKLDTGSFISRAITAGIEHEKLPPNFVDGLMAFLRLRSMSFAQAQRTSIALGKDKLRRGVEMGITCIDIALESGAENDLNKAVDILSQGQFEVLFKRGWELAFGRLEKMRERARLQQRHPYMRFFPVERVHFF